MSSHSPLEMDGYHICSKFPEIPLRDSLLATSPLELDDSQFSETPLRDSLLATSPLELDDSQFSETPLKDSFWPLPP